jgi:hypothetical protein
MDKRVIIILVLVIVIVAGIGAAILLLNKPAPVTQVTPTPIATPVAQTSSQAALTASVSQPLSAGGQGTIDIYLDTKSAKIEGFQFILNIGGTALPTIPDSDPITDGVQIVAESIPGLSISTNSVTQQDGTQVIRFAMVSSDTTGGFSSTTPTKIASIPVSSENNGSVTLTFNQQNSRIRPSGGGEDAIASTTDASFPVSAASVTASTSGTITAATATVTPAPTAIASVTSTPTTSGASAFCLASCFTDNDCAAGFVCEADRCVNPACPTSQTCGCGVEQTTATSATTAPLATATPKPSITPKPTATPKPTPVEVAVASSSASSENLPTSGAFEYTLLVIGAGLLFLGGGVYVSSLSPAKS